MFFFLYSLVILQYRMGSVEVEDQVNGIKAASSIVSYIDLTRVGIIGWSYGKIYHVWVCSL